MSESTVIQKIYNVMPCFRSDQDEPKLQPADEAVPLKTLLPAD